MFNIFEKKGQTIIQLTKGDSCEISTDVYLDANNDNKYNVEDYDQPITLGVSDYVMFTVGSPSGRIYIKRVLTVNNYNDQGVLTLPLYPVDTKDMQPFKYLFSFAYYPNSGENCYTYNQGIFELLPAISTVTDLKEYLNPPTDDAIPDDDTTDDGDDTESIEPDTPTDPDDNDNTDDITGGDADGNGD